MFSIANEFDFNEKALQLFNYQLNNNLVYKTYCGHLNIDSAAIDHYTKIPFLPISFFKTHRVTSYVGDAAVTFSSSGTTGAITSKHHVKDPTIYEASFIKGFELNYGPIQDYVVLGLLPSYLEREGSSLIYMVDRFIQLSAHADSGFFLDEYDALDAVIKKNAGKKILLIGVTYALLDFGEKYSPNLSQCIVMETGGMKGKRKEMIKAELHMILRNLFSTPTIHSEYGMTELLSQAYSEGLKFTCPPWMKILIRSHSDPFELIQNKTGGINIIDLANIHSCAFIATQDLGRSNNGTFEVMGRFDNSDIRGCNLLVQ
ncbi:MAG: acyl transferase [Crocinitomix sp.]|nr:acyl transferase [Crocinitomix sp.]